MYLRFRDTEMSYHYILMNKKKLINESYIFNLQYFCMRLPDIFWELIIFEHQIRDYFN